MTLLFTEGHNCVSNVTSVKLVLYLGQYLSCGIQTWHDGRLMHGIQAHARFDGLGHWCKVTVGQQMQTNQRLIISTTKQATSIELATTVGHFVSDLDFETVYMA